MIVVTAPTGQIGSELVKQLLGANEAVRVIARNPARLSADVRKRVEVVQGSHYEASVVREAFKGANAVFWLVPADPKAESIEAAYVDFSRQACEAFRTEGITHVVGVSSFGRGTPQARHAGYITASLAMDDLIAGTGVHYRALANAQFMDNILRQVATIKGQGTFAGPTPGEIKAATCATRDIASMAARLLIDRSWTGSAEIPMLGPQDLSFNEMAEIMTDVLKRPVHYQEMTLEALNDGLLQRGRSEAMAQGMVDMMRAVNEGIYSNAKRNPESRSQTTFRQFCSEVLAPAVLDRRL